MAQLTVYKASAGSGKTFTLATEYIKLLIRNPQGYRGILAVTFTNKATEEMKLRILSQLYGIWKQLPSSESYVRRVTDDLGIGTETASERARVALTNLLHNYSYFRVETIDSFFQSVLRNLARELDLTANLRVGLNDSQVEEQAVDDIIERLEKNDVMLSWLIEYIQQNIDEDKSWNIIGQVKKFGKTIFRDYYKEESGPLMERVDDPKFFPLYIRQLESLRRKGYAQMQQFSDRFAQVVQDAGLTPDSFAGKARGIGSYFRKLAGTDLSDRACRNKTVEGCLADREKWTTKTSKDRDVILALVDSDLMALLQQAETERPRWWRLCVSAELTLRHLGQLRLLSSIEREVNLLNEEANRFLLSNTQQLLHELIDHSDSPFIFEKMGTQLEHIMIDEFQDTSTVQWQNFKVLMEETMSHANSADLTDGVVSNLIVGDVKQSIYRWRSGDWRLLNGIEKAFGPTGGQIDVKPLAVNWRSCRRVIEFNNAFFALAADTEFQAEQDINPEEAGQLRQAYGDVRQTVPDGKPEEGLVRLTLLPKNDYPEAMLEELGQQVDQLLDAGVAPADIAILVRANRHIPVFADFFMKTRPDVKLVSDEAFQLDASLAVNTLVAALRVLVRPADALARAQVEKTYLKLTASPMGDLLEQARDSLLALPVTDLMEQLFQLLHLEQMSDQSAYLCAFYDQVREFSSDFGTDIEALLSAWDDSLHDKTIQSDEADGIRLISIHKSKGLEFDSVIVPYCDWRIEQSNLLWCRPTEEPFSQLPLVPVDYSGKLQESIYRQDYAHEHLQNCVDNLNLLYVAFTRAARNLFVIGKRDATNSRSCLIQDVVGRLTLQGATLSGAEEADAPIVYEYGELSARAAAAAKPAGKEGNVFLTTPQPLRISVRSYHLPVEFRQSNRSRELTQEELSPADEATQKQLRYIKAGNIMHLLFSQIRTADDIPRVLASLQNEGILYDEDMTPAKIGSMLRRRLADPRVAHWFSPHWKLFNECRILSLDADGHLQERRPDRVMTDGKETIVVDFKFGTPHEQHEQQVQEYMQLLQDMGHSPVKGFLWYVYSNQIKEVR